jgi:predicted RNA-binding Zn ribbon-like protein
MLVSMRLAKKYAVPREIALLYEFLNSTDLRRYVERGKQHVPSDELKTAMQLEGWMRERGVLRKTGSVTAADHRRALALRDALRVFLKRSPESRPMAPEYAEILNKVSESYPVVVRVISTGIPTLQPAPGASGLGYVLAELCSLAESGRLDRLKMCNSEECQWVFLDRSKPGNRRWCSSTICGNRQKTRDYRTRTKAKAGKKHPGD